MVASVAVPPRLRGVRSPDLARGEGLYTMFHGVRPSGTVPVRHSRVVPPVLVELGDLVGVIYRARKNASRPRVYVHLMQDPPGLMSDPAGRQLYIVGGTYRVTERGIEDLIQGNKGGAGR